MSEAEIAAKLDENFAQLAVEGPSALQRCTLLLESQRLWDKLHGRGRGGDRRSAGRNQSDKLSLWSFPDEAAQRLGLSRRSIFRDIALAEALGDDLDELKNSKIARNAAALRVVATLGAGDRDRLLAALHEDPDQSFTAALRATGIRPDTDPDEALFRSLVAGWARANTKVRRRFLAHIGQASSKAT